jgi:hypothetical protein
MPSGAKQISGFSRDDPYTIGGIVETSPLTNALSCSQSFTTPFTALTLFTTLTSAGGPQIEVHDCGRRELYQCLERMGEPYDIAHGLCFILDEGRE